MFVRALAFILFLAHVNAQYTITGITPNPAPLGSKMEVTWTRDPDAPDAVKFTPAFMFPNSGKPAFQANSVETKGQTSGTFLVPTTSEKNVLNQDWQIQLRKAGTPDSLTPVPFTFRFTDAPPQTLPGQNAQSSDSSNVAGQEPPQDPPITPDGSSTTSQPIASSPTTPNAANSTDQVTTAASTKLSKGVIAAVVVGSVVGSLLIVGGGILLVWTRSRKRASRPFSFNRELMVRPTPTSASFNNLRKSDGSQWEFAYSEKSVPIGDHIYP